MPTWTSTRSPSSIRSNPDPTQEVDLEGLYAVLGKVPNQDVR